MTRLEYTDRRLYWLLLQQARSCWALLATQFVVSSLAAPIALLLPVPLMIVVDGIAGSHSLPHWLTLILPAAVVWSATSRGSRRRAVHRHFTPRPGAAVGVECAGNLRG